MSVEGASSSSEAWLAGSEAWLAASTSTVAAADAPDGGTTTLDTQNSDGLRDCFMHSPLSQPSLDLPTLLPSQGTLFLVLETDLNP